MDIGNIGHPNLVDAIYRPMVKKIRINSEIVIAVGGVNPFAFARPTAPAFLTHDPSNLLVVDRPSFALQLFGDPAISILWKFQADLLHTLDQSIF